MFMFFINFQRFADGEGGAAGAFGAGMVAFFQAQLRPGIEAVLDLVGFDDMLEGCDMVFTGEGRLDSQSLRGKVLSGVGKRARAHGVPEVAIVGGVTPDTEDVCDCQDAIISAIFTINRQAMDFEKSKGSSHQNYQRTFENILRLIQLAQRLAH